jgi:DNA-binding GntR family transcriptional regulator
MKSPTSLSAETTSRARATSIARSVSAQLSSVLRERIVGGHYSPNQMLLQDVLAEEFGVSKIPVREALVRLAAEGLVDIYTHRGFQVRPLSWAEYEELARLRLMIEPNAVVHGAKLANENDHRLVEKKLIALNQSIARGEPEAGALNSEFHLSLITPQQQPLTAELLGNLLTRCQRYVLAHLTISGKPKRAQQEHDALFEAWRNRDLRDVRLRVSTHIQETLDELRVAMCV